VDRKFLRGVWLAFPAIAALLSCSCGSVTQDRTIAQLAVSEFHSQLDSARYDAVYAAAGPKFHDITTEADLTKLLDAVHRKLGTVKQANLLNWKMAWYTGQGETVDLTYAITFSAGSGKEEFLWHIDNHRALLYGYHINSVDLIEK